MLSVRDELGTDALDPGASAAFAVADHQVAHVHVREPRRITDVRALLERTPGVDHVLDSASRRGTASITSAAASWWRWPAPDAWFTYYYWLDDRKRPTTRARWTFTESPATTPPSLFLDPALRLPKLQMAATLARKELGFRYLMNVIPLDATLVRGSHGRLTDSLDDGPVLDLIGKSGCRGPVEAMAVSRPDPGPPVRSHSGAQV